MREVVLVPTYRRNELLACCLKRIRSVEPNIEIHVFPDRGTFSDQTLQEICAYFKTHLHLVPDHDWFGNTANTMNAYLWAFNAGYDRTFYVEDDCMVHSDFFSWHRTQQEMFQNIFASMAWVFNRHAPLVDDLLFQPWFYAVGVCFSREKLSLVARHATPRYYEDMPKYIGSTFKVSPLNVPFAIAHFEHDGCIQRILDEDKTQTVSPGIAKCDHCGFFGYNRGWGTYFSVLDDALSFAKRVEIVEEFIADPYARAEIFGREIVEREVGQELPKREFRYRITLPGGWESEFHSELKQGFLPRRINSVPVPADAKIVLA